MKNRLKEIIFIRPSCVTIVCATLLSLFVLVGYSFKQDFTLNYLLGPDDGYVHAGPIIRAILLFVVLVTVLERVLSVSFMLIMKAGKNKTSSKQDLVTATNNADRSDNKYEKVDSKGIKIFLISFIAILAMWIPYYVVYFPGSVPADGLHMIREAIGEASLSNHHSWVLAYLLGRLFKLGSRINQNVGVFTVVCTLGVIEALCYAYVIKTITKWNASKWLVVGSILFIGIMPGFGTYAQAYLKDGVFYAVYSLMVAQIMDILWAQRLPDNNRSRQFVYQIIALIIIGIALSVIRRDAMIRIVAGLIVLIVLLPKRKKLYGLGAMLLIINGFVIVSMLADSISVEKGRNREPLSIPFQQTARYLITHPDDVTEEELEVISQVLNIDVITTVYNPELSDLVKETYNEGASHTQIKAYIKVWLAQFARHPRTYIEATLSNSFAYLYPFYQYYGMRAYQTYIKEDKLLGDVLTYEYANSEAVRDAMENYIGAWRKIPVLQLLLSCGAYTWLLLICHCYMIYSGRRLDGLAILMVGINVFIFIGSPVNGLLRYTMAVIACVPQVLAWSDCAVMNRMDGGSQI